MVVVHGLVNFWVWLTISRVRFGSELGKVTLKSKGDKALSDESP
jgi:hypothetical protein